MTKKTAYYFEIFIFAYCIQRKSDSIIYKSKHVKSTRAQNFRLESSYLNSIQFNFFIASVYRRYKIDIIIIQNEHIQIQVT